MSEWQPIETHRDQPGKYQYKVYYYPPIQGSFGRTGEAITTMRHWRVRNPTHWMGINIPEREKPEHE